MHVELAQVGKRFGSMHALQDVSLQLPAGSRTALIGPNGSGKSTLTRIIMGMLTCTGEVRVGDLSPFKDRVQLLRQLAYVPQIAPRLAATVQEVVRAVAQLRQLEVEKIREVADALGLDLTATRRQQFRNLSGGMRQKLLLALALSADVSLLILDEPTASLDAGSRQRFFQMIEDLPNKPTLLLCSHRLEEIRHLVKRVLVLEEGRLSFDGEANAWLRRCASSVLEIQVEEESAADWLADKGFQRGLTGWWTMSVLNGQRVPMLNEITSTLGARICDILVRDQEKNS